MKAIHQNWIQLSKQVYNWPGFIAWEMLRGSIVEVVRHSTVLIEVTCRLCVAYCGVGSPCLCHQLVVLFQYYALRQLTSRYKHLDICCQIAFYTRDCLTLPDSLLYKGLSPLSDSHLHKRMSPTVR